MAVAQPSETPSSPIFKNSQSLHPSLALERVLGPDIHKNLFDWVLDDERFIHWQQSKENLLLRCNGTPGSGKTTLSALAVNHLRERHASSSVAAVFIQDDVLWSEAAFIEDFLASIWQQLSPPSDGRGEVDSSTEHQRQYESYLQARSLGQRSATRIKLIREAIYSHVSSLERAFLVIDDFDRCSPAVDLFLEDELPRLRQAGLRIMITSRIPCLREPIEEYNCDGKDCPNPNKRHIYWECQRCRTDEHSFVLCHVCMKKEGVCRNCKEDSRLIQPYEHVDLDISMAGGEQLREFVAWSLECEHGDLGLGSPCSAKPPLSALGRELVSSSGGEEAENLVEITAYRAGNNIAISRARLELIHGSKTLEAVDLVGDRLPPSITALFDAGISRINAQHEGQRELGLRAIAAVAQSDSGRVRFADLQKWLTNSLGSQMAHRSLEEMLHAVKGFLVATMPFGEVERFIEAYHEDFRIYASEGYNDALVWAAAQLKLDRGEHEGRPKRSQTFQESTMTPKAMMRQSAYGLKVQRKSPRSEDARPAQDILQSIRRRATAWG